MNTPTKIIKSFNLGELDLLVYATVSLIFGFGYIFFYGFTLYIGYILNFIFIFLVFKRYLHKVKIIKIEFLILLLFFLLNILISLWQFEWDWYALKMVLSAPLIIIFIFFGFLISKNSYRNDLSINKLANGLFYLGIILTIINIFHMICTYILGWNSIYIDHHKYHGFFNEPSFFGKAMIVIIAFNFFYGVVHKKNILLLWLVSLLTSITLTYLILSLLLVFLIIFRKIRLQKILLTFLFILSLLLMIILVNYIDYLPDYFRIRLYSFTLGLKIILGNFDGNQPVNSMTFYYIQGWLDAFNAIKQSNGFGAGFNRMGMFPRYDGFILSKIVHHHTLYNQNLTDGSFLLSKVIYEFGIFGIFFYLYFLFRSILLFVSTTDKLILSSSVVVILSLLIFGLRSGSYFLELIIVIFMPYILSANNKRNQYEFK
jgi:hypothetical protein